MCLVLRRVSFFLHLESIRNALAPCCLMEEIDSQATRVLDPLQPKKSLLSLWRK